MLKVGGTTCFEVVLTRELEVLAILMEGRKKFPPFKRGGGRENCYPVSRGGGREKFWTINFPIL